MMSRFVLLSVPAMLSVLPQMAAGAIRVGNLSRSYADAYNQVTAQNTVQTVGAPGVTATDPELPVRVANKTVAAAISRGDANAPTTINGLEKCAAIYPNGKFAWDTPTVGLKTGAPATCVAIVEMRTRDSKTGTDVVLARANLAAGDTVTCNISQFPESGYLPNALETIFPADNEPTIDDVKRVMNDEQKKNAGLKIAAGTVIGGLVGNFTGKNDAGHDSALGTDKGKMRNTAIGALSGAALMAGSSYAGKVGGDIILSTGVNAAAGATIGNIMATGNAVMRIEECEIAGRQDHCLWGTVASTTPISSTETAFINLNTDATVVCDGAMRNCQPEYLGALKFPEYETIDDAIEDRFLKIVQNPDLQYTMRDNAMTPGLSDSSQGAWVKLESAGRMDQSVPAMVAGVPNKTFGMKRSDWVKWRNNNPNATIYGRSNAGAALPLARMANGASYQLSDFNPILQQADDGSLIDFGNRARTQGTLIGAGAGAGMGAFTAYQGAQSDIEDSWVTAVREYKDSLQKIYCFTGDRFLGHYNAMLSIPNPAE